MTDNLWHPMTTPPPILTDLLFGLVAEKWVSAGWVDMKDKQPVIIGGQFAPDCWRLMPAIELDAAAQQQAQQPLAAAIRAELCGIDRYDENLHQLARKLGITL